MWFFDIFRLIFLLVFCIHFSLFRASSSLPPPVAGDMRVVLLDDFFLPLKARSSVHFVFTYFADFVALPFRGVGGGIEEPHLRLMFLFVESGFP